MTRAGGMGYNNDNGEGLEHHSPRRATASIWGRILGSCTRVARWAQGGCMARTRKTIPPRLRFEVLKRDGFACVYCGAAAPGVLLQVDHVEAMSLGGSDEINNLVTACSTCNGGKSCVPLTMSATAYTKAKSLERAKQIAEVDAAYNEWLRERRVRGEALTYKMVALWNEEAWRGEFSLTESAVASMRYFAQRLGEEEMREAMSAAIRIVGWPRFDAKWTKTGGRYRAAVDDIGRRFRYFCGACHNMIRRRA